MAPCVLPLSASLPLHSLHFLHSVPFPERKSCHPSLDRGGSKCEQSPCWSQHPFHPRTVSWHSRYGKAGKSRSHRFLCVGSAGEEPHISRTQRIMESLPNQVGAGGAGGMGTYAALKQADALWAGIRAGNKGPGPEIVRRISERRPGSLPPDFDIVVCGGTLGVFIAAALALRGFKVAIVERGELRGRDQEWNISKKELEELAETGVLSMDEIESCINVTFNPMRCGFHKGQEVWVKDILNLGVLPEKLIEKAKQKFLVAGGVLLEKTALKSIDVFDDVAAVHTEERTLSARLVLDAMGNFSPVVRQIRWGQTPDGVCLVVGARGRGFTNNSFGDLIYSNTPMRSIGASPSQYFWEAFPAGSGPTDRTTYLFTYLDADPARPSLESLLEEYWDLMPPYQGVELDKISFLRVLFGFFPTYRDSPLEAAFDRVIQVGDASGIQSPLSFGGFGSITRHLKRLTAGFGDALDADLLDKRSLSLINSYQPNLRGAWLLQRAMSARVGSQPPPHFINDLLTINFNIMQKLGDPVIRPFLQDVTQFGPLAMTMGTMMVERPDILPSILSQVGVGPVADWLVHFIGLGAYTALSSSISPAIRPWVEGLPAEKRFAWQRRMEAWQFGAGLDYRL